MDGLKKMKNKKINNTSVVMNEADYVCDRCGSDDNVRPVSINYQMMLCRKCFNRRRKISYGILVGFVVFTLLIFIIYMTLMILLV